MEAGICSGSCPREAILTAIVFLRVIRCAVPSVRELRSRLPGMTPGGEAIWKRFSNSGSMGCRCSLQALTRRLVENTVQCVYKNSDVVPADYPDPHPADANRARTALGGLLQDEYFTGQRGSAAATKPLRNCGGMV